MIKHPQDRKERRKLKALHDNASPVAKLLKEKEDIDARDNRMPSKRRNIKGPDNSSPDSGGKDQVQP